MVHRPAHPAKWTAMRTLKRIPRWLGFVVDLCEPSGGLSRLRGRPLLSRRLPKASDVELLWAWSGLRTRSGRELLDRHADIAKNAPQGALGDVAVAAHRDRGATSVRVAHDVMATGDPGRLEAVPLQGAGRFDCRKLTGAEASGGDGDRSSRGTPNSSMRPVSASRRSSSAASSVSPSPCAPRPGRSWAWAHHTPSSSRSTTTGTVTVRDPAMSPPYRDPAIMV